MSIGSELGQVPLACLGGWALCAMIFPRLRRMLEHAGLTRPNYRGNWVPVGGGLIFLLAVLTVYPAIGIDRRGFLFLFAFAVMTLAGLLDDLFGDRRASGLQGHFRLLLEGQVTTGALKAAAGVLLGLLAASVDKEAGETALRLIVEAAVIALSANAVNLLDLRPGRAGKAFVAICILLLALAWPWVRHPEAVPMAVVLGAVLNYLPHDLRAQVMMGDAGSNALGIALGLGSVWLAPAALLPVWLGALVVLHLVAERVSISRLVEKNGFLNYLDNLGRE